MGIELILGTVNPKESIIPKFEDMFRKIVKIMIAAIVEY